jgi:hypothetical protein
MPVIRYVAYPPTALPSLSDLQLVLLPSNSWLECEDQGGFRWGNAFRGAGGGEDAEEFDFVF